MRRWAIVFILALLCGCSGTTVSGGGGGGSTVVTTSNAFTLEPTVKLLPETGITVGSIEDGQIVLSGNVPAFAPGDVLVKNTGDEQFIRKVVSVTQNGDQFVIVTGRVGFSDIFNDASIQQTEVIGADVLRQFEPAMPGVTFGEPEPVATRVMGREVAAFRLPINFDRAVVDGGVNGSIQISGSIGIRFTVESALEVHKFLGVPTGLKQFKIVPGAIVDGNLSITGSASGSFRKQVPLSQPLGFSLVGFGPVGINANTQLVLEIDGYVQADGSITMSGKVTMEAGIEYTDTNGWSTPRRFVPEFSIDAPDVRVDASIACSAIKPKFSINVLGMGEVWVDADLLRIQATFEFVTQPERGYRITTYRDFGFNAGGDLVVDIGIAKLVDLHARLPRFDFGRRQLDQYTIPEFPQPPVPNGLHIFPFLVQVRQGEVAKVTSYARYLIFPVPEVATWSSDDPSIAQVTPSDKDAYIQGLRAGETYVRAVHPTGAESSVLVRVLPPELVDLRIQSSTFTLQERWYVPFQAVGIYSDGSERDLSYYVRWSASNGNALVYRNGDVEAVAVGDVDITAFEPFSGKSVTARLRVVPLQIKALVVSPVDPKVAVIPKTTTQQFQAYGRMSDGSVRKVTTRVRWHSYDTGVVTVDGFGQAAGVELGGAYIVAYDTEPYGAYAYKGVQVGLAPMTGMIIEPQEPSVTQGRSVQVRAYAILADQTRIDITDRATWASLDTGIARVSRTGVVSGEADGRAGLLVSYSRFGVFTHVVVRGPVKVAIRTPLPVIARNQPFGLTVDLQDETGSRTDAVSDVLVELLDANNQVVPLQGVTRVTSAAGRATFTGLRADVAGQFRLRASSPGLTSDRTAMFTISDAGALARLFVPNRGSNGPNGLTVLNVSAVGALSEAQALTTANRPLQAVRVGNGIYVGNSGSGAGSNSIDFFRFDPATQTTSLVTNTGTSTLGTSNQEIFMATNGSDALFATSQFDGLVQSWRINPDGSLTQVSNRNVSVDLGTTLPHDIEYYDIPANPIDMVVVADPNFLRIYTLDSATLVLTPAASCASHDLAGFITDLKAFNGYIYATNVVSDRISRFQILAPGLAIPSGFGPATGTGPVSLDIVPHAGLGNVMYVGNQISGDISANRVNPDGSLTVIGPNVPAGEVNPHGFASVVLSPTSQALYVGTSNRVAAFMVDPVSAVLTAFTGSPFAFPSLSSPGLLTQ